MPLHPMALCAKTIAFLYVVYSHAQCRYLLMYAFVILRFEPLTLDPPP